MMEFEWSEKKRQENIKKRGIDFAALLPLFTDPDTIILKDGREEYGEERFILFGYIRSKLFQVGFTERGQRVRIFTARRANERERRLYERCRRDRGRTDL